MNDLELAWLIPTTLQVIGLAMALGVLGFAYEGTRRERKPLVAALEEGHRTWWLALAGVVFAGGMGFTQASWGYKGVAGVLAAVLIGLAWTSRRDVSVGRMKVARGKPTVKSMVMLGVKIWLGIFLVMVVAWGISLGWHALHLYGLVREVMRDASQIQTDEIVPLVHDAAGDIGAIQQELSPLYPIFNILQGIPKVGDYLGQVEPLLAYADGLAQAGNEIALGLEPLLEGSPTGQIDISLLERASQVVQSGQDHFVIAAQEIDQANQGRSQITPELLPASIQTSVYEAG